MNRSTRRKNMRALMRKQSEARPSIAKPGSGVSITVRASAETGQAMLAFSQKVQSIVLEAASLDGLISTLEKARDTIRAGSSPSTQEASSHEPSPSA